MSSHVQISVKKKLDKYFATQKKFFVSGYDCCCYLKNEHSFMKDISCSITLFPLTYTFFIKNYEPICLVNKKYIILNEDNTLYSRCDFKCEKIVDISVDEKWCTDVLDKEVHQFFASVPQKILEDFLLTFHNYFFIVAKPRSGLCQNVSLYIRGELNDWSMMYEMIQKVLSDASLIQVNSKKKKRGNIIIDMRFYGHIVIKYL